MSKPKEQSILESGALICPICFLNHFIERTSIPLKYRCKPLYPGRRGMVKQEKKTP